MKNLRTIISRTYGNSTSVLETMDELGLFDVLQKSIEKLEQSLSGNNPAQIAAISSALLTRINLKIEQIEDAKKKKEFQACIVDVFKAYIPKVQQLPNGSEAIAEISESLRNTCDVNSFDYNDLNARLGLEAAAEVNRKSHGFCYYEWNGTPVQFDFLLEEIKPWIKSKNEFRKLFDSHHQLDYLIIKKKFANKLFLLIDILHQHLKKPLKSKGTSGKFKPLTHYCVDSELKFVYEDAPNKRHESLKRNQSWYPVERIKLEEMVNRILNP